MSKSVAVNEPSTSAKSSFPSPRDRTGLAEGGTIVAMGLFIAVWLVCLMVAMIYLDHWPAPMNPVNIGPMVVPTV
jgi:hypothetical protein